MNGAVFMTVFEIAVLPEEMSDSPSFLLALVEAPNHMAN